MSKRNGDVTRNGPAPAAALARPRGLAAPPVRAPAAASSYSFAAVSVMPRQPAAKGATPAPAGGTAAGPPAAAAPATPTYVPTWAEVVAAAGDDDFAKQALDVAWIPGGLQERLVDQIDSSFTAGKESAAFELVKAKAARALRDKHHKAAADLAAATRARQGIQGKAKPVDDLDYQASKAMLSLERWLETRVAAGHKHAAQRRGLSQDPKATAVRPINNKVSWGEGRTIARVNFMAWGIHLLGSAQAVKDHFRNIVLVDGTKVLYLHRAAATRFVQARTWFTKRHLGNTFLSTDVGQNLRGRHQGEHSRGQQGHPLGIAVDFDATRNPHQHDGLSQFMLRHFGGIRGPDGTLIQEGDNQLHLGKDSFDAVAELGRDYAAGNPLSRDQEALLNRLHVTYEKVLATSKRFKQSLTAPQMEQLRAAQQFYYANVQGLEDRIAALGGEIERARKAVKKRSRVPATAEEVDATPEVVALLQEREGVAVRLAPLLAQVQAEMAAVFAPWVDELQKEATQRTEDIAQRAGINASDVHLEDDTKVAIEALNAVTQTEKSAELKEVLVNPAYGRVFGTMAKDVGPSPFKKTKNDVLERATKARADLGEITARLALIRRLTQNARAVFGERQSVFDKKSKTNTWTQRRQADYPSVTQYLELGFLRGDDLNDRPRTVKAVFNAAFMHAMMLHGFHPLGAFRSVDMMHFDFEEGYRAVKGTAKDKFGPTR